jgi:F-type H+-transporting ATPase subunit b
MYAISNEYYIMNEETVVAFCLLSVWTAVFKFGGPAYSKWADAQNDKIKSVLNQARADHTDAVHSRISDVKQMSGVVDVTKALFEVSKVRRCFYPPPSPGPDFCHACWQSSSLRRKGTHAGPG